MVKEIKSKISMKREFPCEWIEEPELYGTDPDGGSLGCRLGEHHIGEEPKMAVRTGLDIVNTLNGEPLETSKYGLIYEYDNKEQVRIVPREDTPPPKVCIFFNPEELSGVAYERYKQYLPQQIGDEPAIAFPICKEIGINELLKLKEIENG